MRRVAQDGRQGLDVREAHHLADARVVLQHERGDDRRHDGQQARGVDAAGRDARMLVRVVRLVLAHLLQHVLQVVRDQVHAHEQQQHAHREAGEDFGALEPEGMPDAGALPHLEVGEHVDDDAQHGAKGVEEDEMRECSEGQRAGGAPERVGRDGHVADGPVEALFLLGGHAAAAFGECGNGERGGQRDRGAGGGFEEDLVRDAAVLVFVAAALADAL